MSVTVDHPIDGTVTLREVGSALVDPRETGFRITTFGEYPSLSITDDHPEHLFMAAGQQLVGSFLPAVVSASGILTDLLWREWVLSSLHDDEDDLVVMPPVYRQQVTIRIRTVSHGVPSSLAFED